MRKGKKYKKNKPRGGGASMGAQGKDYNKGTGGLSEHGSYPISIYVDEKTDAKCEDKSMSQSDHSELGTIKNTDHKPGNNWGESIDDKRLPAQDGSFDARTNSAVHNAPCGTKSASSVAASMNEPKKSGQTRATDQSTIAFRHSEDHEKNGESVIVKMLERIISLIGGKSRSVDSNRNENVMPYKEFEQKIAQSMQAGKTKLEEMGKSVAEVKKFQKDILEKMRSLDNMGATLQAADNSYKDLAKMLKQLKTVIDNIPKDIDGVSKQLARDIPQQIGQTKIQLDSMARKADSFFSDMNTMRDNMETIGNNSLRIEDIQKSVEMLEGFNARLEPRVKSIEELLANPNLRIENKFPAVNENEEVLATLAGYGETIIRQLALAARWYARRKHEIENIDAERTRYRQEREKLEKEEYRRGFEEGKKEVYNSFLKKIDNYEALLPCATHQCQEDKLLADILRSMFSNILKIEYRRGDIIEIKTHEDLRNYESWLKDPHLGKLYLASNAISFYGEPLVKAECTYQVNVTENTSDIIAKSAQEETTTDSDSDYGDTEEGV